MSDYREAYSAIDDIPGSESQEGNDPSPEPRQDPKPERREENRETPKDEPKPAAKPKEAAKPKATSKRSVGDDLEAFVKKPEEAEEKSGDDPKEESGDDPDFDSPSTPRKLRDTYKKTREELTKASARVRELEETVEKTKRETAESVAKEYETRLAETERRRAELETNLRYLDYERSEDFKSRYQTPLREAWKEALSTIEGMTIPDGNGGEREVSPNDIAQLMGMNNVQARRTATELFGTAAPEVMTIRAKLLGLTTARNKALEEWKTNGSKHEEELQKTRAQTRKQWEDDLTGYQTEHPDVFGAAETDAEGRQLLAKGTALARKAFLGEGLPDGLTPEQRREQILSASTMLAARGAAFPRVFRDLTKAQTRIAELEKQLADLSELEPEPGRQREEGGRGKGGKPGNPEDAIDELAGF